MHRDQRFHAPRSGGDLTPEEFQSLGAIGLTPRECEVLFWVAQGKRDAEIGVILGVATKTISKHLEHLLAKLQAGTRTEAVAVAQRQLASRQNMTH